MSITLLTLEDIVNPPQPKPIIKDCLSRGDLAVVIGSPAFTENLGRIVRPAVVFAPQPGDSRPAVLKRITPMRQGRHPSAVILTFPTETDDARWWSAEADCVLRVESPTLARIEKLRNFDDHAKGLEIQGRTARVTGLW